MQHCIALSVQVHELAANIPAFLSSLLESGMYQSLFSTLQQLGDCALYSDHQHGPALRKRQRSDRVGSNLAERFSKLLQFSVNCLSSFEQPIIEEEIGLATAIYNMSLELEADMSRKKESDNLVKSLRDCAALGGVTLLLLIKSEISLSS